MSGRIRPAPPEARDVPALRAGLALLAPLLLVAAVVARPRDPWSDEAMLAANLLAAGVDPLAPLPLYEHAAPAGYVFLVRGVLALLAPEDPIGAMRLVSAAGVGAGIAAMLLGLRWLRDWRACLAFAALALGGPMVWDYSSEIKHYGLEFAATAFLLAAAGGLTGGGGARAVPPFALAILFAAAFAFTAAPTAAALLAAVLAERALTARADAAGGRAPLPVLPAWLALTGGGALALLGGVHLALNADLVHFQIAANEFAYRTATLGFGEPVLHNIRTLLRLPYLLLAPTGLPGIEPALRALLPGGRGAGMAASALAALLLAGGMLLALRRARFLVLATLAAMGLLVALNAMRMLPFEQTRHFFFLAPLILATLAAAIGAAARRLVPPGAAGAAVLAGLAAVATGAGMRHALDKRTQEVTPLLERIAREAPQTPVWVHYAAQPAARILRPQPARMLGLFDSESGLTNWGARGGGIRIDPSAEIPWQPEPAYPDLIRRTAAGEAALWLLFAGDWIEPSRAPFLAAAGATVGPCALAQEGDGSALYLCGPAPGGG